MAKWTAGGGGLAALRHYSGVRVGERFCCALLHVPFLEELNDPKIREH